MVETVTLTNTQPSPTLEQSAQALEPNSQAKQETQTTEVKSEISDRPNWLPDKFNNVEDLAKAYKELEQKFSSKQSPKDMKIDANTNTQPNKLEKFYDEYAQSGELSENSFQELEKLGFDRNLVNAYIEGQRAVSDKNDNAIMATVGGEDNYKNMVQWASENLEATEIDTFNNLLTNGSLEQIQLAVAGVNARYRNGTREPSLLSGSKSSGSLGYQSVAEMLSDMNNPKYNADPAFRKSVEDKIKLSSVV